MVEVTHLIFVSVDLYVEVVWTLTDLKHDQFFSLNMMFVVLTMLWHVTVYILFYCQIIFHIRNITHFAYL